VFDVSEHLEKFIQNDAPLKEIVFNFYFNFIPYFANLFSSLFTFIAVIFFTSKLAYNTEIIAILSSGISFRRLMRPYLISAGIIALMSFMLSSYVIPKSNKVRLEFYHTYIKRKFVNKEENIHRQIKPGVFIYMSRYNARSNIGYDFEMDEFEGKKLKKKLTSSKIRWDENKKTWTITKYRIRSIDGDKETFEEGKKLDTLISIKPTEFSRGADIKEEMTTPQLNAYIKQQTMRGSSNVSEFKIEKYKRFASAFATFILTFIGAALASRKVRGGMGFHLGIGLGLSFTYIMFMQVSTVFATNGNMSPLLAVWLPNIIFAIIAIVLYRKAPK
jgi:lipopolysaccharide export system permease protein